VLSADVRERFAQSDPLRSYREVGESFRGVDAVQRSLHMDCKLLLPGQFLPKVDRSTMSQSIETRVPFLDAELTEYVIPIASRHKVRGLQKKYLLRRALRGTVPDEILDRPKQGFGVPIHEWLGGRLQAYLKSVLFDDSTRRSGLFDRPELEACLKQHVDGTRDNGFLLYKSLLLALWHREYIDPA
jgi:asparagine synthase (glutamine-hydrolysing)